MKIKNIKIMRTKHNEDQKRLNFAGIPYDNPINFIWPNPIEFSKSKSLTLETSIITDKSPAKKILRVEVE